MFLPHQAKLVKYFLSLVTLTKLFFLRKKFRTGKPRISGRMKEKSNFPASLSAKDAAVAPSVGENPRG